jgi:hypothetical protein
MLMEIAAPRGNLVVHFGNSVLDRHGVSQPPNMSFPRTRETTARCSAESRDTRFSRVLQVAATPEMKTLTLPTRQSIAI